MQLDPTHSWAAYRLALVRLDTGHIDEAIQHFRHALQLDPAYKDAKNGLRIALIKAGQFDQALAVWEATLSDKTASHQDVDGLAELYLYREREGDYHRVCAELLERFGATSDALVCERLGRSCLLKPNSAATKQKAVALIDRAVAARLPEDQQWALPFLLLANAFSEYRQGEFESTLNQLEGQTTLEPIPDLLRAMALYQLDRHTESRSALARAQKQLEEQQPKNNREAWLSEILRREAASMIATSE